MNDDRGGIFSEKKDRVKHLVCGIIGVCIALIFTGILMGQRLTGVEEKTSQVQEKLAEEVFRFHVLANSDREEDQAVKLKVRDSVISYMKESMGEEKSAEATRKWAEEHLNEVTDVAEKVLEEQGVSYGAKSEVTNCYFPEKCYGDITFPEGNYEALRIELGKADGRNWWCVLYPNLCFMDTTCAVVSDEGKKDLKEALDEDEYEMVTASTNFKIKWFFFGESRKEK